MLTQLTRLLAVVALALSPVWGFNAPVQAHNADYPVWPSFLSTGCQAIQGPTGFTTVSCGVSDFLLTQVNSGYACNQLDISIGEMQSGPWSVIATVNSGSQSNSVTIDGAGSYFMQFPGFLVNNLITIQIAAPNSGTMSIASIQTNPCPVATATPTINPSSTATNTPVPVTGTVTPIPTYTPLPSGHSTFTPTVTRTGTPLPATATVTATPAPSERDCGAPSYPLLNCDFLGGVPFGAIPTHWISPLGIISNTSAYCGANTVAYPDSINQICFSGGLDKVIQQDVMVGFSGTITIRYQFLFNGRPSDPIIFEVMDNTTSTLTDTQQPSGTIGTCNPGTLNFCTLNIGTVANGDSTVFGFSNFDSFGSTLRIDETWIASAPATPTPAPATATASALPGTPTATPTATDTQIPIPGAISTAIPTDTECPGGCAVADLTHVPSMATITTVDTSPFSPLLHLSLARSTCEPFGFALIPLPVIHGTPALGSTTPLSYTWTVPLTSNWDDSHPYSNTAIQPCAMVKEIPTFVWDLTYWLSVLMLGIGYVIWLIGVVGRLSGEETING